jgi:hypothetical protein
VAIVQVSRITQRKGLEVDLPQPLAGAEFGWAVDQRRLYIGNGSLADGAPVVGNTEVLTEFSDILAYSTAYTYEGQAAGYTVQTGPTAGDDVTQSLQSRLDSYAIVTDFGAVGDGNTDDTEAINRALNQLYCVQNNVAVRRSLFFPAGTYVISDTILIPAYAKLYGEGADHTIISFQVQQWAAFTAFAEGILVKYEDPSTSVITYYRAIAPVPATGIALTDTTYWDSTTLPNYAVTTADSQQQTGANIGVNGATAPRNIEVSSMTFQTLEYGNDSSVGHNIALIEKAQQCYFDSVNFNGPLTTSQLDTAVENLSAILFASVPATVCTNITFDKCKISGVTYGVNTDQQVQGITFSNGWFDTMYQGVILGDNAPVDGGPAGVRIMHNTFDNIYAEGVVIENCSLNASAYNTFYDVGNRFNGSNSPASPVISINADNNVSIGDMFERTTAQTQLSTGYPRIYLYNTSTSTIPNSIAYSNSDQVQLGNYVRQSGVQKTLLDGFQNEPIFTVNTNLTVQNGGFQAFKMDYTIYRVTAGARAVRTGTLTVVAGGDDSATDGLQYTDDYSENTSTDIVLSAEESGNVVTVAYSSSSTTYDGTLYYSVTHLA